jgi:hypothetical protein
MTKRNYWLLFGAVQVVGLIAPWFANVHTNPFPLPLGLGTAISRMPRRIHVSSIGSRYTGSVRPYQCRCVVSGEKILAHRPRVMVFLAALAWNRMP